MREANYHLFFGMFASKLRIDIVAALRSRPMGVTELAEAVGAERSRVSHALLALNKCRLVEAEKSGKSRVYSLNRETTAKLLGLADRHAAKYCKRCWAKGSN
jgi:DNA-binding transcriptional ArsR family regulator